VISDPVAFLTCATDKGRPAFRAYVATDHEEGCLRPMASQTIQNLWGDFGRWSIVERECHDGHVWTVEEEAALVHNAHAGRRMAGAGIP